MATPITQSNAMLFDLPRGLKIANWNCQGLLSKLTDVTSLLAVPGKEWDILGISESWLDNNHLDSELLIPGYWLLRKDRGTPKRRGGTAAYIDNHLNFSRRTDLETFTDEFLWIELKPNYTTSIFLCICYKPPNTNTDWMSRLETSLSQALSESQALILMGDFNIDLLVDNSHSRAWLDLLNLHGLTQIITEPTRVTTNSRTLIDHVIVSNTEYVYSSKAVVPNLLS